MRNVVIFCMLCFLGILLPCPSRSDSSCGPEQSEIRRRARDFMGREPATGGGTTNPPKPEPPTTSTPTPRPGRGGGGIGGGGAPRTPTYDTRDLGSYYYDRGANGGPLTPREQQSANDYRNSAIELRNTPVSWNKSPFDESQRGQINQMLDRIGVNYDKNSNTIPTGKGNNSQAVEIEDRVRKVIQDNVREPFNNVNNRLDTIIAKLRDIEGLVMDQGYVSGAPVSQPKANKKKKVPTPDRMLASLPQIEPEQAASDPINLDEIINQALYIKDTKHWSRTKSVNLKQSQDRLTAKYSKETYKSVSQNRGNEIRILELIDAKDNVTAIKAFAYQADKRVWVPVFYKLNGDTGIFVRQTTYHDQKLPYACLNCHGNSPRSLTPDVSSAAAAWPKK